MAYASFLRACSPVLAPTRVFLYCPFPCLHLTIRVFVGSVHLLSPVIPLLDGFSSLLHLPCCILHVLPDVISMYALGLLGLVS